MCFRRQQFSIQRTKERTKGHRETDPATEQKISSKFLKILARRLLLFRGISGPPTKIQNSVVRQLTLFKPPKQVRTSEVSFRFKNILKFDFSILFKFGVYHLLSNQISGSKGKELKVGLLKNRCCILISYFFSSEEIQFFGKLQRMDCTGRRPVFFTVIVVNKFRGQG